MNRAQRRAEMNHGDKPSVRAHREFTRGTMPKNYREVGRALTLLRKARLWQTLGLAHDNQGLFDEGVKAEDEALRVIGRSRRVSGHGTR